MMKSSLLEVPNRADHRFGFSVGRLTPKPASAEPRLYSADARRQFWTEQA